MMLRLIVAFTCLAWIAGCSSKQPTKETSTESSSGTKQSDTKQTEDVPTLLPIVE